MKVVQRSQATRYGTDGDASEDRYTRHTLMSRKNLTASMIMVALAIVVLVIARALGLRQAFY